MADFDISTSVDDVTDNLLRLHSYARGNQREREFHFNRVYNAEHQVYYKTSDGPIFAPVKWCGAKRNTIAGYDLRKRKISQVFQRALNNIGFKPITKGQTGYKETYKEFTDFCYGFGFKNSEAGLPHSNSSRSRQFWSLGYTPEAPLQNFSDEVVDPENYIEGATNTVSVNSFERNPRARLACIAHYGWICQVCDIDFQQVYGDLGAEFIHVHHIRPLHEIGEQYEVDPVADLRPVCPNCHAMIHRRKPILTIEELSEIIKGTGI
ncbi:MAG: HNH endonuclease [Sphingorhabdus sp.]